MFLQYNCLIPMVQMPVDLSMLSHTSFCATLGSIPSVAINYAMSHSSY